MPRPLLADSGSSDGPEIPRGPRLGKAQSTPFLVRTGSDDPDGPNPPLQTPVYSGGLAGQAGPGRPRSPPTDP